jgi:hypothetical protein
MNEQEQAIEAATRKQMVIEYNIYAMRFGIVPKHIGAVQTVIRKTDDQPFVVKAVEAMRSVLLEAYSSTLVNGGVIRVRYRVTWQGHIVSKGVVTVKQWDLA